MKRNIHKILSLVLAVIMILGVFIIPSSESQAASKAKSVTKLKVAKSTVTLNEGSKKTIKVTVSGGKKASKKFKVSSSNEDVAEASVKGKAVLITANGAGTATITVTTKGKTRKNKVLKKKIKVKVKGDGNSSDGKNPTPTPAPAPTNAPTPAPTPTPEPVYAINKTDATIESGKTLQLSITVDGVAKTSGVSWTSSDKKVATVDTKGLVTGQSDGDATITATTDGKTFTCTFTVNGFDVKRDLEIKTGTKNVYINFDLATDEGGNLLHPEEVQVLEEMGCTVVGKNVSKNQVCETATYTFKKLPKTLVEIQSLFDEPEEKDTVDLESRNAGVNYGGFNAMAANICAACTYEGIANPADPLDSNAPIRAMLEYINGPASKYDIYKGDLDNTILSMKSAIQQCGPNVFKAYFKGATSKNNYTPTYPYVLEMYKGPYYISRKETITGTRPTTYMILIPGSESTVFDGCEGFGSDRYIDIYYSPQAKRWFSYKTSFRNVILNNFKPLEEED